jgi:RHS repeat-associated protein
MRTRLLSSLLLALAAATVHAPPGHAQFGTSRASFTAPTAATLGRFGEVPVALYTGQPDISIPLFTAAGRELQLPVTLRYQGGGVRVDEVGGWAGMGWTLEAGGAITRTVRGIPDDHPNGYWNTGNTFYDPVNWPMPSAPVATPLFQNMQGGHIDGEPDQWFFNFGGRSGQFVIGPTSASSTLKEVRTTPYQKLRFEPGNNFKTWTVTTEDGTQYIFAAADTTLDQSGTVQPSGSEYVTPTVPPPFISSWHLTEVRSPGGDVIQLFYTSYQAHHEMTNGASRFDIMMSKPSFSGATCPTVNSYRHIAGHQIKAKRLDSIRSATHTIRFIPDATLRADALDGSTRQEPRLAQIEVRTPAGTVLRRFVFDHDYFGGNRLRLKSVQEQDAAGNGLPPWSFEYDAQDFPARNSFAQDHGGYWNGKTNPSLVPAQTTSYTLSDGTHTTYLSGADREPNLLNARVGTLSKLTYPTGGSTSFVWELHEYGTTRNGTVTRDSAGAPQSASAGSVTYQPTRTTTTTFTIGGTEPALVNLDVIHYCTMGMPSCAWAKITGPGIDQTYTAPANLNRTLSPGTYTLTATSPASSQFSQATITVTWQEVVEIVGRKPGAGLRIAEVRTTDGHGPDQVRKYRYRLQSDTARSSGLLPFEPVYGEWIHGDGCDYFSRTASSNLPLGAAAPITYREVTILHGENGEFGRTRETFRNVYDNPDNAPPVPAPNLRLTSWEGRQGQRLTSTVSNAAGQVQQRTKSLYSFRMDEPTTFRRFRGMSLSRFVYNQYFAASSYRAFEVVSEWSHLAADSVFHYDEAGNASVWTARAFTHGNPAHTQLTQLDETGSDGSRRITRMRYPADYADGILTSDPEGLSDGQAEAHALTMMKGTAHVHSPVIERWVSEVSGGTERVLQSELTTYLSWPTVAGRSYLPGGRLIFNAPGPVTDFVPASVTSAAFAWESRYQVNEQVSGYDSWGRVRELTDANDAIHTYTYGGNANNAFLTQISRHPAGGGTTLTTTVGYDASGYLSSLLDEGGSLRTFSYDGFGRLRQIRGNGGTVLQGIAYTYSRTPGNGWAYQASTPNAVTDTTYQRHSPTVAAIVSSAYVDGLGRPIQTVQQDGAAWHVAARQYDATGRMWRLWKRYPRTTAGFDPGFAANATAFFNSDLGVSNAQPYADSLFSPDPLRRVKSIVPEYVGSSPAVARTFAYGVDTGTGRRYTETTDEAGKKQRAYTDGFGNEVRTVLGYGATEASTAQLSYNALGQRTQLTDPRGIVTQYTRNTRGLVTTRTNPDAGNRSHKYDRAGNLRYTQDANQAAAGQVHFSTYDFAGRPLVSGVGAATFAALDPQVASAGLEMTTSNWREVRHYDGKPSTTAFPWSLFATQLSPLTLNNVNGRLAAQASASNGAWQADFYSYDADGKVAARYTFTQASGGSGVLAAANTTLGYTRDLTGMVTHRSMTVGGNSFHQWYDYNGRGQLAYIYASTSSSKPAAADAAYTYRSSGRVGQRQFQGGPAVPVRYTVREQLERIGDPAGTAYPFSARYSYHPNGRLQEQEFYSAGSPAANKRYGYVFGATSWDALNRLRGADYSAWTGTGWNTTAAHDLSGITYDAAGNITALGRYQEAGLLVDNLVYGYGTANNRLSSVSDNTGTTPATWDAETGAFTYDANGNVKTAPAPYGITAATYDHRNLPLSFTAAGVTSTYRYNGEGQRIVRQVGTGNVDVYVKEGPATLGVMTVAPAGTATAWHFNLLAGEQVVGRQPNTGNRRYYHRDMLGSTRAVVEGATVVESYDYDPWGVLMPGRVLAGATRERFTGKEQDAETGLQYYGARYYMSAYGRWTSVDPPADSFPAWNPYNYVEGNPVSYTDPYGLCPICVAYGIFEVGSTLYDLGDLAVTAYRYSQGRASGTALAVTATGVAAGIFSFGGGLGRAGRAGLDVADDAFRNGWRLVPGVDLDWRGTGKGVRDAVQEALRRTGVDPGEFRVTRWGRDANGKSFPVEWRSPGGAEVNIDIGHVQNGPGVPHVGYQTPGKRGTGGNVRGHILLDEVPVNR